MVFSSRSRSEQLGSSAKVNMIWRSSEGRKNVWTMSGRGGDGFRTVEFDCVLRVGREVRPWMARNSGGREGWAEGRNAGGGGLGSKNSGGGGLGESGLSFFCAFRARGLQVRRWRARKANCEDNTGTPFEWVERTIPARWVFKTNLTARACQSGPLKMPYRRVEATYRIQSIALTSERPHVIESGGVRTPAELPVIPLRMKRRPYSPPERAPGEGVGMTGNKSKDASWQPQPHPMTCSIVSED